MKLRSAVGLGLALIWGGCVQILDADYEYKPQCTTDTECDDGNPCTSDSCSAELAACEHTALPDGPLATQVTGDCRRDDCLGGEVVPTNDDTDIADDGESCTTDTCSGGNPVHTALADQSACTVGMAGGLCAAGVCTVDCSDTKPCDDMNPCSTDSCDTTNGTCTFTPLDGMPTPGFQEPAGDCQVHVCQMGADTAVMDDVDIPVDMNSCTDDICTNGAPSNPPIASGTPCVVGQPAVCDGAGSCVECNVPADCVNLPPDDDCQTRTCVNNICGQDFTAMGTPISTQSAGDCKQTVCDGTGKTMIVNLDTDVPEDNNPCTMNLCTNGVPNNPNEAPGISCGSPRVCDGMGNCLGCITPNDCTDLPPNDFCKVRTCINSMCGLSFTPAGTDLPTGQTSMDCKVLECDAVGNVVASPDPTDKPNDGNQCTLDVCSLQGVPSNPPEPVNTACNQNGGTLCNGAGACKVANGNTCAAAGDCLSGFCVDGVCCDAACGSSCKSCNVPGNVGKCVNVPKGIEDAPGCTGTNSCDGLGTCKKDDGQGCGATGECVSNFCVDGVCCASACTAACNACNIMGSVGTCTPLTSGEDNVPANVCNGPKGCDASGICKSDNGQACTMGAECVSGQCFDGVCCNVACSGTCKSCNIAGAVGTCSNVAAGLDDPNGVPACSGTNQSCDGMGGCKKENGQTCGGATDCLSGFCADGVCCNAACTGTCQACNLAGSIGSCTNVASGQDDVGTCSGASQSCDGAGACKSELGTACSTNANCLSGFCVDGFCCNTACTGTCQACSALIQGQGTNGTCGNIILGTDPDNECVNGSCNGSGTCKQDLGTTCSMATQCLSGFCADGVCCNSACGNGDTTDCQACSVSAGATVNGTCAPRTAGSVCRASSGACDVAETCNGSATTCPVDGVAANGTVCRAVAGSCDVAETCNGMAKTCPADAVLSSSTVCRAAVAGGCDVAELCTGLSGVCPTDAVQPSTTVCRPAAGGCDVAEKCTGSSASCPIDTFNPMGTVCRPAGGLCDIAETCTGSSASCPFDAFKLNGTVCRPPVDVCDAQETCTGSSAACPVDVFKPSITVCRPAAGDCDVEEMCTGSSAPCPVDSLEPATTVCRTAVGACDVAEMCDGTSASCPLDVFSPMGTICVAQSCSGSTQTNADTCDGSGICVDNGTTPCNPYLCGGSACKTICMTAVDCAPGFTCVLNMCQ